MTYDVKKADPLYKAKETPALVTVTSQRFLEMTGQGDPNEEGGAYSHALAILYGVAYALKMSYKTDYVIPNFQQYVVAPLEGLWWQEDQLQGQVDYSHKTNFHWRALIRVPDFIRPEDVAWAKAQVKAKKGLDCQALTLASLDEGLCVQCLHLGSYDKEPATMAKIHAFIEASGYELDFQEGRHHHEIYLSDPRRVAPDKLKTILRVPVKPKAS